MFKAVISRDDGEPWGDTGMTTATWATIQPHVVRIADLIATQPGILFAPLTDDNEPVGGDPIPHVIHWQGDYYLEDGHHRAMRALINGADTITARILEVP
jgi:hypothetical protein